MKKFKKIYLEITNQCNLKCNFCIQNQREAKFLSHEEFKIILDKIEPYTDYLYFHIMGEPLLHPNIKDFFSLAHNRFNINITTNGYLINKLEGIDSIRQINISLHSYDDKYNIPVKEYMNNIFKIIDSDSLKNTYISLRFWVKNEHNKEILNVLNSHYNINLDESIKNYKINNHIFINNFHEFIWPDLNNNYYSEDGGCHALKDHIGILSNGNVVPCCLDSKGDIILGNIYTDDLNDIINSNKFLVMINGFKFKKKKEELCKHCCFFEKQNNSCYN